jgi:2-polyprenyl-3-methyl-5-hydroxy-6-metoxy-1,4-benzoquinol methylase
MNPSYTDGYLHRYYASYGPAEPKWEEPRRALQSFYLDLIAKHTRPLLRLLDVGSGQGYLLEAASQRGLDVVGYEVDSETAADVARGRGLPVLSGPFEDLTRSAQPFDAIVFHHVLEHLKDPRKYLDCLDSLLRPGGTLFVAVPNIRSISIVTKMVLERLGLRRLNLGRYYDTSHHLFYYTPGSLSRLLRRRGYGIITMRGCHRVRPAESPMRRWFNRNIYDRPTWRSGFLVLARRGDQIPAA